MTTLRRDAARNRERILAAAREQLACGEPLQLNAVARRADVGIGTVYRHFGSPDALSEGLVEDRFVELIELAKAAAHAGTPDALRGFLADSLQTFVDDPAFAAASMTATPAREETRALRADLIGALDELVHVSRRHLRPGIDPLDLMALACGLGYSARLRPEKAALYRGMLLDQVINPEPADG